MADYAVMPIGDYQDACDAIREKDGSTAAIKSGEMGGKIRAIDTAIEPEITVSSAGLITATSGTKSATKQLDTQAATTITPGTSDKTAVSSGKYTTGAVTIKGDANLKAANIKKGVSIFGVAGSMAASTIQYEVLVSSSKSYYLYFTLPDVTELFGYGLQNKSFDTSGEYIAAINNKTLVGLYAKDVLESGEVTITKSSKQIRCRWSAYYKLVAVYDPSKTSICD